MFTNARPLGYAAMPQVFFQRFISWQSDWMRWSSSNHINDHDNGNSATRLPLEIESLKVLRRRLGGVGRHWKWSTLIRNNGWHLPHDRCATLYDYVQEMHAACQKRQLRMEIKYYRRVHIYPTSRESAWKLLSCVRSLTLASAPLQVTSNAVTPSFAKSKARRRSRAWQVPLSPLGVHLILT